MDSGPSGDGRGLLRLKYFSKPMVTRHSLKIVQRFISSKVYCMACMLVRMR